MSINKIILLGRTGQYPVYSISASGVKVVKLNLATSKKYTDNDNIKREKTLWHNCVAFGNIADTINKWVKKGDQIYLEGEINYRIVEKNGNKFYYTDILYNSNTYKKNNHEYFFEFLQ